MVTRARMCAFAVGLLLLTFTASSGRLSLHAQNPGSPTAVLVRPITFGVSPAARDLGAVSRRVAPAGDPIREVPIQTFREEQSEAAATSDAALQRASALATAMPAPSLSFDGLSNQDNFNAFGFRPLPPDTNGDVGPNHYVQQVNLLVRVFDKSGTPLTAPFKLSSLWQSVGGVCAVTDSGDPVVLYDPLADRWMLSQFGFLRIIAPPYYQCIAISQTPDPTGPYYVYTFETPGDNFPDYPKLGVWPDAYYMTTNQFLKGGPFNGAGVFAFDRTKMLAGDPDAGLVYFDLNLTDFPEGIGGLLPSDFDGLNAPEPGSPNVFSYFIANEFGDALDGLRLFDFHVDFDNPAASTFTERPESPVPVAPFNPLTPPGRDDIEQPPPAVLASQSLDSISDRLMHRLAYRRFAAHESLVVTHTVNVGTGTTIDTHQAGVRYYELRRIAGGAFGVAEQATFAPDTDNRWMGSAAIDHHGNLAVGYSVSSLTTFPSIRYAGRLATDPPGGLFQGEQSLVAGSGVQTHTASRWGDYSALSVDPQDDCAFWYTTEYYTLASQLSSSAGWLTRIGRFAFPSCTPAPKGILTGVVTDAASGAPLPGAVVTADNGFSRTTDATGTYSMALAPGTYVVTATAFAHEPASATVTIVNGQTTTQDFALVGLPLIVGAGATLIKESCSINGALDPNEQVTAEFALRNVGFADAIPVHATLEASGGVIVGRDKQRSYGRISPGETVARKFTFSTAVPCGGTVTATLRLRTSHGEDLGSVTFAFMVGAASPTPSTSTYSSGDLNTPILDFQTVEIALAVSGLAVIDDVDVRVRLDHTFDFDLTIALVGPDGTTVVLASGNGGSGDNFGTGAASCSGQPTVFDDSAATPITGGVPPFAGTFRPRLPLSAFNGRKTQGTWRVRVSDSFRPDQGTLYCVEVVITSRAVSCCTAAPKHKADAGPVTLSRKLLAALLPGRGRLEALP